MEDDEENIHIETGVKGLIKMIIRLLERDGHVKRGEGVGVWFCCSYLCKTKLR